MEEPRGFTALVPAAGLGTRMIPATKELPKEMLPVPEPGPGGTLFKPFIQVVYERLYGAGARTFVFVVGRGKRILQDHFVKDEGLLDLLRRKGKELEAEALREFYRMLDDSTIIWVDQPEPRGLGDAVLRGLRAIPGGPVLIHLGDILVESPRGDPVKGLWETWLRARGRCPAGMILLAPVEDPSSYGVAIPGLPVEAEPAPGVTRVVEIRGLVEKPREPPSSLAITGVYLVDSGMLRRSLERARPNPRTGEVELTDSLDRLARESCLCGAVADEPSYLDIGRPGKYLETLMSLAGRGV